VRIPDVFEPEVVDRLAGILEQTIDWDVICSTSAGGADILSRERRAELGGEVVAGKLHAATLRARTGFAYVYLGYPMIDAFVEGRDPGHPIHALTAFLNSPEMIAFGAAVTGEPGVTKIDAQATSIAPPTS
jgi:SM-20-related protein